MQIDASIYNEWWTGLRMKWTVLQCVYFELSTVQKFGNC